MIKIGNISEIWLHLGTIWELLIPLQQTILCIHRKYSRIVEELMQECEFRLLGLAGVQYGVQYGAHYSGVYMTANSCQCDQAMLGMLAPTMPMKHYTVPRLPIIAELAQKGLEPLQMPRKVPFQTQDSGSITVLSHCYCNFHPQVSS